LTVTEHIDIEQADIGMPSVERERNEAARSDDVCPRSSAGSRDEVPGPGQYADKEWEDDLYYNWNRYYIPHIGRYNRADPLKSWGILYLYSYNNPLLLYDFSGLESSDHLWGINWKRVGKGAFNLAVNGFATMGSWALIVAPEPLTTVAGIAVAGKAAYGIGAAIDDIYYGCVDSNFYIPSNPFEFGAEMAFSGNQNARLAANIMDFGFDLASMSAFLYADKLISASRYPLLTTTSQGTLLPIETTGTYLFNHNVIYGGSAASALWTGQATYSITYDLYLLGED